MALQDIIDNSIQEQVPQMIDDAIQNHTHNGGDSQQLQGQYLSQAPQPAVTAASQLTLSSGGSAVLSTNDATILNNALVRVSDIVSKLQSLGLIS